MQQGRGAGSNAGGVFVYCFPLQKGIEGGKKQRSRKWAAVEYVLEGALGGRSERVTTSFQREDRRPRGKGRASTRSVVGADGQIGWPSMRGLVACDTGSASTSSKEKRRVPEESGQAPEE